jgi:myo-inositol 2-dehydrogenase/D-chiro-inositol 1-dehydrogenase
VVDLAIHSIDYLLWLFNQPVVRVYAVGAEGKINLPTYANITIGFADGAMALVETSWAQPHSQPLSVRTELVGSTGRLHWDYDDITSMYFTRDDVPPARRRMTMVGEDSFAAQISEFVKCIETDTPPPVSGEEATAALRVALAAAESIATGRAVHFS